MSTQANRTGDKKNSLNQWPRLEREVLDRARESCSGGPGTEDKGMPAKEDRDSLLSF